MCVVVVLALFVLPALGAGLGYTWGATTGAWLGALAGLLVAALLVGAPLALLFGSSRKRLARERRLHPEDRLEG